MPDESPAKPDDLAALFAAREEAGAERDTTRQEPSANEQTVDATCLFEQGEPDKKRGDVAFAMAVLESGTVSERQLSKAVRDWTIHGDALLAEHLVAKSFISAEARIRLEQRAQEILQQAAQQNSTVAQKSGQSTASSTLQRLDAGGRVARLLGLAMVQPADADQQDRKVATNYRLLRRLGQGGMGTVWLARDEMLGRLVAIKEIRADSRDSESVRHRFRREAQVTGRLEHPSIVPVHQFAEDADKGPTFYVMRFLGKRTLEDAIAQYHERREAGDADPMHLHHLLSAFVTVCQAIAYAHSRHVVHRDLKPENIALDDYGQVIVLDWGLAKLTGRAEQHELFFDLEFDDLSAPHDQTMAGHVLGTPMYMAPEQAAGRVDEIDATTDVYGLGAILYNILTGAAPHETSRETLRASGSGTELLQAIVSRLPQPADQVNPDAPPQLAAICAKAMANRQYARYGSAVELADDVQRWMAGEAVSTYKEPWLKRVLHWMNVHRRTSQLVGVTATIILVSAVTLGVASYQSRIAQRQARFENLKADARELEVSLESISDDLQRTVRFMAALPPIQGIIDARHGAETDEEDVWLGRLNTIYRGLLEANPDYISATYAAAGDALEEIVRVERNDPGSFVRVVPSGRLQEIELSDALQGVTTQKPGDVTIASTRSQRDAADSRQSDGLILTAAVPVYSQEDGILFGVVLIETDLHRKIQKLLSVEIDSGESVYLVDGRGQLIAHDSQQGEFRAAVSDRNIGELVEGTESLFAPNSAETSISIGQRVFATRMELDPRHKTASLGFVLTLDD